MLTAELNLNRRLGCEYEMTLPLIGRGGGNDVQQTLAHILTSNGLPTIARSYSHSSLPDGVDLAVESDASVLGESRYTGITWHSIELKTRILNGLEDWERIVPQALAICRYMGARVNKSTGHHVHIDYPEAVQRPTVIRSLYNFIHRFEPVIFGLVAPSRSNNRYTRSILGSGGFLHGCRSREDFRQNLMGWSRHCGLNLTHLWGEEPRIEFRYHQGTLDVEKSRHWIRLLNRLVEHAVTRNCQAATESTTNDRKAFEALRYSSGLRSNAGIYAKVAPELKETSKYLLRRWKQFNSPILSGVGGEEDQ